MLTVNSAITASIGAVNLLSDPYKYCFHFSDKCYITASFPGNAQSDSQRHWVSQACLLEKKYFAGELSMVSSMASMEAHYVDCHWYL